MDEIFVEQIIKRRINAKGFLFRALSILAVMVSILLIGSLMMLGITITALVIYLTYMVWSYTSVEYEYSLVNGEFAVDSIMGQRKRKRTANFDLKQAEIIAPTNSDEIIRRANNIKKKDYSSGYGRDNTYSMILTNNEGLLQILFEPNEKMLEALYHVKPSIVKKAQN